MDYIEIDHRAKIPSDPECCGNFNGEICKYLHPVDLKCYLFFDQDNEPKDILLTDEEDFLKCDECKKVKNWDNWKPIPKNINALPEKLKLYVSSLQTLCDPAGIIAENILLKDEMSMFIEALKPKEKEPELKKCPNPECGREYDTDLLVCCPFCDFEFPYDEYKEKVENPCIDCGKEWNNADEWPCPHCGNEIPF